MAAEVSETVDRIMDHLNGCFHDLWVEENDVSLREWLEDELDGLLRSLNDN